LLSQLVIFGTVSSKTENVAHEQGDLLEQRPETEEIFVRSRRVVAAMGLGR